MPAVRVFAYQLVEEPIKSWPFDGLVVSPVPPEPIPKALVRESAVPVAIPKFKLVIVEEPEIITEVRVEAPAEKVPVPVAFVNVKLPTAVKPVKVDVPETASEVIVVVAKVPCPLPAIFVEPPI